MEKRRQFDAGRSTDKPLAGHEVALVKAIARSQLVDELRRQPMPHELTARLEKLSKVAGLK